MKKRPNGRFFYEFRGQQSMMRFAVPQAEGSRRKWGVLGNRSSTRRSLKILWRCQGEVRRTNYRWRVLLWALLLPLGCWAAPLPERTLVLVSIDGFRWDYLDRPEAR